jgi:Vitamin K-dependent gamma-carboxylase
VAVALITFVYVAYTVGWHTRLMQALAAVAFISLDQRNLMLENGGGWVVSIVAVTTAFLPLGDRFSLDSLRVTRPAQSSIVRLAYGLLMLDLGVIYLFNALHKTGASWKDGTAIHLVIWHTRVANSVSGWLRGHEPGWFSPAFTRGTLFTEFAIAALILCPVFQRELRRTAILLILGLHAGIALLMTLGPFAYVMMCLALLLVSTEDWAVIERVVRPRLGGALDRATARLEAYFGPRVAPPELAPEGQLLQKRVVSWLRDGATLVLAAAGICSLLYENRIIPAPLHLEKRPDWVASIDDSLRMTQKWTMFSPDAPRNNVDNGAVVVDGELANHEHVDPLTGLPPDFMPMFHAPLDDGNPWRDYLFRVSTDKYTKFRAHFRDYLLRVHTLPDSKIHEPLIHVDVYWVSYTAPPHPGEPPFNIRKKLLISGAPAAPTTPEPPPAETSQWREWKPEPSATSSSQTEPPTTTGYQPQADQVH